MIIPPPVRGAGDDFTFNKETGLVMARQSSSTMRDRASDGPVVEAFGGKSLLMQILRYLPGAVVPAGVVLASSAVFTREFNPYEFGQYSLVLSFAALCSSVVGQWLQQSVNRFLPGETDEGVLAEMRSAVSLSLIGTLAIATLGVMVTVPILIRYFSKDWGSMLWPAGVLVVTTSAFTSEMVVFQAQSRAARHTAFTLSNVILRFLVSILLIFAVRRSPVSLVWANVLPYLLLIPLVWRSAGIPFATLRFAWRRGVFARVCQMIAYGLPMSGWFLAATVLNVGDRYLLQWLRGSAEVGIYSANYTLVTGAVTLLAAPVLLAAHPFLVRAWVGGQRDAAASWLGIIVEWLVVVGIIAVGFTWLFAHDVSLWLLGPQFREGYKVMPVVLAGVVVWQLSMYTHKPLEFVGRTGFMFGLAIISAAVNLVANLVLIPVTGYMGAAYSTLISYVIYFVLTVAVGRSILRWTVRWKSLLLALSLAAAGFGGAAWGKVTLERQFGYWPSVWACLAIYGVTMGLVLFPFVRPLLSSLATSRYSQVTGE